MDLSLQDVGIIVVGIIVVMLGWALVEELSSDNGARARHLWQRFVMSRSDDIDAPEEMPRTSMPVSVEQVIRPDTTAVNAGTPHRTSSTRQSDAELVAYLAMARTPDGKERFSANAIAVIMGGTRSEVLDQVRAIRKLPTYPPRTSEQEMVRKNLELV